MFVKDVGIGADTHFWIDKWLGDVPFKDAFPIIFRLETTKGVLIMNRVTNASSSLTFTWNWSTEPRRRTADELNSLIYIISGHTFSDNTSSKWSWKLTANDIFCSSSLSQFLNLQAADNMRMSSLPSLTTDLNPFIPQKIGIFVWRAKQDKLPVRMALDKKGIDLHFLRCPVCDGDLESLHHTLITCNFDKDIWERIRKWWKLDHLSLNNVSEIAKCPNPPLSSNLGITIWQAIVWVSSYYIWSHRNVRVFGNNCLSPPKIIAEIQSKCYEWINCLWKKGSLKWLTWIMNPKCFDATYSRVGVG
ncbi:uncharacterized protein [Rutidosis leptorrhynchoides]|uniref:uncharacterized protein n=1 Tax=Rutidosis leptorrhynchoides TaxID=125765 RepID=UPI003A99BF89